MLIAGTHLGWVCAQSCIADSVKLGQFGVSANIDEQPPRGTTLSLWQALTRYCADGRIEINNNATNRALRAVAPVRP